MQQRPNPTDIAEKVILIQRVMADLIIALTPPSITPCFVKAGGVQSPNYPLRGKGNVSPFPLNPFTTTVPLD